MRKIYFLMFYMMFLISNFIFAQDNINAYLVKESYYNSENGIIFFSTQDTVHLNNINIDYFQDKFYLLVSNNIAMNPYQIIPSMKVINDELDLLDIWKREQCNLENMIIMKKLDQYYIIQ